MTTSKHTPGPWISDGGGYVQAQYSASPYPDFYYTVARTDQPLVSPDEASANSRLIAAAPELLEALERMVAAEMAFREGREYPFAEAHLQARAAIAKARGQ